MEACLLDQKVPDPYGQSRTSVHLLVCCCKNDSNYRPFHKKACSFIYCAGDLIIRLHDAIHRHFVMLSNIKISASHFLEFLGLDASLIKSEFQ